MFIYTLGDIITVAFIVAIVIVFAVAYTVEGIKSLFKRKR
jgi:hypothetical protein